MSHRKQREIIYSTEHLASSCMPGRDALPSPPEKSVGHGLLQVLYPIPSGPEIDGPRDYHLPCRWFVGLSMDNKVWNHAGLTKNQESWCQSIQNLKG